MDAQAIDLALKQVEATLWSEPHRNDFLRHKERYRSDATIISQLLNGSTILEVGSFPGHFTALMAALDVPCIGVDIAPERLGDFTQQAQLDVRRCDIERQPLPFEAGSFSTVIFSEVFEHLRVDPLFVLSELNRVLQPGGHLLLTTPNLYSVQQCLRFLTGRGFGDPLGEFMKLRTLGHMGHVREYSHREMKRFLEFAGFDIQQLWYKHYYYGGGKRGLAKRLIFSIVPARFRTFQVILATKSRAGIGYSPLAECAE